MKITALGLLAGSVLMAASDVIPSGATSIFQGSAFALLGWMVWYLLAKALPAHYKAAATERSEYLSALDCARKDYLSDAQDYRKQFCEAIERLERSLRELHDSIERIGRQ